MTEPSLIALQANRTPPPKRAFRRGRAVCRYCGAELIVTNRARGACDAKACKKKDRRLRDQIRRERDEIDMIAMRAAVARAVEAKRLLLLDLSAAASPDVAKIDPAAPALTVDQIATTNHLSSPLVDVDSDDLEDFETRLLSVMRKLFAKMDEKDACGEKVEFEDDGSFADDEAHVTDLMFRSFEERAALEKPASPVENATCAACRGNCCARGFRNLAFIRPADVARFRRRDPEATPDSLTAAIMAYVPDKHVKDSCLFHGEFGCTIPREQRSTTCNGYKCGWLQKIIEMEKDGNAPRLVAGLEDGRPKRAFFVDAKGGLSEVPVNSSVNTADLLVEAARGETGSPENDQMSLSEGTSSRSADGGTGS